MRETSLSPSSLSPQAAGFNPRGRSPIPAIAAGATLRPLQPDDAVAIERWYSKATVLAGSAVPLRDVLKGPKRQTFALSADAGPDPFGLLVVALDDPEPGWATVALLAIAGPEGHYAAAEGVALLETRLRDRADHVRAAVPPDVGLALYFWLRLGYRPVASGGGLWMIRELEA